MNYIEKLFEEWCYRFHKGMWPVGGQYYCETCRKYRKIRW